MASWARASSVGEGLLLQFIALHANQKNPLKNCWGASATWKPLTNHLAKHWNLRRNRWRTTEVPAPHIPHRRAEEPLKNCRGATQQHIHPQKNLWRNAEDPQRFYYLMQHRQPPKNSWGTTEEPLRCWHHTHPREPLRNQWGTTEILYSTSNRQSLMEIHSGVGFLHHECFAE